MRNYRQPLHDCGTVTHVTSILVHARPQHTKELASTLDAFEEVKGRTEGSRCFLPPSSISRLPDDDSGLRFSHL